MKRHDWVRLFMVALGRDITFEARATSIGSTGIGGYEIGEQCCFDHGKPYVEEFEVRGVEPEDDEPMSREERTRIMSVLYNDLADEVSERLEEAMSDE